MTNFEKYMRELTVERFAESMILNCAGCPAYPCIIVGDTMVTGSDCYEELLSWCNAEMLKEGK